MTSEYSQYLSGSNSELGLYGAIKIVHYYYYYYYYYYWRTTEAVFCTNRKL